MPDNSQHINRKTRRSRRKIFGTIANYIKQSEKPFSKSQLKDIGLNSETAENYIKCFEIIQNTPKIIVLRTGTRIIVGKETYPNASFTVKRTIKKRTIIEIFLAVRKFIKDATEPFHVSNLRQIGLDSITANNYIECFEIAQNLPKILVQRTGNSTVIGFSQNQTYTSAN